ncbi:MFS transporter [Reyranella sp. CPCC 100927]|uniref:MFS transporter n=1 Tax=Reyranella sp. CPCC 100927 TaxID=2599616 RepID=UPI0011B52F1D|nr:MFS transporter [Reyranella sp. CPCC 100927]TWT14030.1 MFS transporter [Reyranella sp. CPCC 100927]
MSLSPFLRLQAATVGVHAADQLALAALPLTAVLLLDAGPGLVGILVAIQGAAWLLASMPAGIIVDRLTAPVVLLAAPVLSLAAAVVALTAAVADLLWPLAGAAFIGAAGTVSFVLAATAVVPRLVSPQQLPAGNARLELGRAAATLAAPFIVGELATRLSPTWGYALAIVAALFAVVWLAGLDRRAIAIPPSTRQPILAAIREGAAFVLRQRLLRGIALCAIFWNMAFFALWAIFVPFALKVLALDPRQTGAVQMAYGAGLIVGALSGGALLTRLPPNVTLLFGPGVSAIAGILLLLSVQTHGTILPAIAYFLVGFGPMLWLICQTTVRQLVTPPELLGRVNATIQVAIYGMRPIGALLGGWLSATFGYEVALFTVAVGFAASFSVVLLTPLVRLRTMPTQVASPC